MRLTDAAGMVAGADSIDDMNQLRHGGMGTLFDRIYAPSTLGSFLWSFTFGHIRQLGTVASRSLTDLATHAPALIPAPAAVSSREHDGYVFVDVDDTIIEVHGPQKQGVGFGCSGIRGLNALLATVPPPEEFRPGGRRPTTPGTPAMASTSSPKDDRCIGFNLPPRFLFCSGEEVGLQEGAQLCLGACPARFDGAGFDSLVVGDVVDAVSAEVDQEEGVSLVGVELVHGLADGECDIEVAEWVYG